MTPRDILHKIIVNKGSCTWTSKEDIYPFDDVCGVCPIRLLPSKNNSEYNINDRTCVMAIGSFDDDKCLDLAIRLLIEMDIEDTIKGIDIARKS